MIQGHTITTKQGDAPVIQRHTITTKQGDAPVGLTVFADGGISVARSGYGNRLYFHPCETREVLKILNQFLVLDLLGAIVPPHEETSSHGNA